MPSRSGWVVRHQGHLPMIYDRFYLNHPSLWRLPALGLTSSLTRSLPAAVQVLGLFDDDDEWLGVGGG